MHCDVEDVSADIVRVSDDVIDVSGNVVGVSIDSCVSVINKNKHINKP